ncbi:MAG TPA: hypothetical protein VGN78_14090 [Solirubrobacteraceae bacterium]|nr:hypothetical protein [Solirubrobacteraceae bacterium]
MSDPERLFSFVQFEFPRELGPADGRYVVREETGTEASHVLVLRTVGAPERRRLARRRPRPAEPEPEPEPVPTARATVIVALAHEDEASADGWLAGARREPDPVVAGALGVLNRALHAHAVASADPLSVEVRREHALVARLGWGRGEQVADGRWAEAVEIPFRPPKRRRADALRPQERLAALLGGRDRPLAAESLALRARLDLDHGRDREAALQLRVALEAGIAELEDAASGGELEKRLGELREQRDAVGAAANAALRGPLDDGEREAVAHALGRLEGALRARALAALDAPR